MPRKYLVYDLYESRGSVAEADTLEDAEFLAGWWEHDTDGECDIVIMQWSDIYQAYTAIELKGSEHHANDK